MKSRGLLLTVFSVLIGLVFPSPTTAASGAGPLKICAPYANGQCTTTADYIVVGSGLGGATLMRKLSDPYGIHGDLYSVIGFETGEYISDDPTISIGANVNSVYPQLNKYFHTLKSEVDPNTGSSHDIISGYGSGGSSSVHGQQYIRVSDHYGDLLESWMGPNWSSSAIQATYKSMENYTVTSGPIASTRGTTGLLNVRKPASGATSGPGSIANVLANWTAIASGIPITNDYNDPTSQAGMFGPFPRYQLFQTAEGLRETSVTAFLPKTVMRSDGTSADGRKLRVFFQATVTKVIIENKVAKGVVFEYNGETYHAMARKEVILATHLYTSQLLQLSGIGPSSLLGQLGIPVVVDNNNVGLNFANHMTVNLPYKQDAAQNPDFLNGDFSIYSGGAFLPLWNQAGPLTNMSLITEVERQFQLIWINYYPVYNVLFVSHMRPESTGYNQIQSNSYQKPPRMWENAMSVQSDVDKFANFLYYFVQETLFKYMTTQNSNYDIGWTKWASVAEARTYLLHNYNGDAHWCCHARMGPSADVAVADSEGRVFGVSNLRVTGVAALPFPVDATPASWCAMSSLRVANFIISGRN